MLSSDLLAARAAFDQGDDALALERINHLLTQPDGASEAAVALLAETLLRLDLRAEAAEAFGHAGNLGGPTAAAHFRRAAEIYDRLQQHQPALAYAAKAHDLGVDDPGSVFLLVRLLQQAGETELVDQLKFKLIASDQPHHLQFALDLIGLDRHDERCLALFLKLRRHDPSNPTYWAAVMDLARNFCDYDVLDAEEALLPRDNLKARPDLLARQTPHASLHWCHDEALNRLARNAATIGPLDPAKVEKRRTMPHDWSPRIRIGYLGADFSSVHATMRLLQDVLRRHDRRRFDITLFCHTPERLIARDDGSRAAWGEIVPVGHLTDEQAADEIRRRNIDILVDLKGHTAYSRVTILNHAAAPLQVSWLGFPGTTIEIDIDYILGDAVVTPDSSKPHYGEKFCRLPESYQPNDPVGRVLPPAASRAALDLPENMFVFASFNGPTKISLETLSLWARILKAVPDSVLWLMCTGPMTEMNIRRRFDRLGIGQDRLCFVAGTLYPDHIARLPAADLALDCFPCNGHTTTSDKLWAGLPVVTARGRHFASRVSESLLRAIGLGELVADDHDGYVALAVDLATDRARLAAIRQRLEDNRFRAPLFDSDRFCRHLECGYEMMVARARDGLPPDHFDIPALPPRAEPFAAPRSRT